MKRKIIVCGMVLTGLLLCSTVSAVSFLDMTINKGSKQVYFSQTASTRSALDSEDYIFGWTGGDTSGTVQSFTLANNAITINNGTTILSATFYVYDGATDGMKVILNTGAVDPGAGSFFNITGQSAVNNSYSSLDSAHRTILENYTAYLDAINGGSKLRITAVPEPATISLFVLAVTGMLARRRK